MKLKGHQLVTVFATWFYLGKLRPAPGTWGTLGAIPLVLFLKKTGDFGYLVAGVLLTALAMVIAQLYENISGEHDRSEIVIDEVVGFIVTMTWVPITWQTFGLGFILFRLVDILKPPPVGWLDQKVSGGVGVVADDIVGGIIVNIILQILFTQTNWLGVQLGR